MNISGGGDTPETTIDGLEFARRLNMRESSDKFFIVVTDAGFKVDNNYNINSMDEMISLLVEGKINTSVITNGNYKNEYSNLYTTTGGIYANVGGNFKEELISIANQIIENTNDGSWIVLNGLTPQIVKLKEKPMYGSRVDSDSDSLTDVDELGTLVPVKKYNAARYMFTLMPTLMPVGSEKWDMYVYNYKSNPVKVDTDGDLDIDSIDPEPRAYQLNDLLCYNISKLNDLAIVYKNQNKYSSREYNTKVESWLTFMFIRQFSRSYVGGNWNGTGKAIDTGFVNYVKAEDAALYAYFESKTDYYATATGEMGDLYHLAATATGYIYNSDFGDGFQFGLMPEYHLNNLSGWAGDLQTAMNDAMVITNKSNDYNVFKEAMSNLIGYDEEVNDVYSGYSHTFDMDDVYADIDAYNMYKLLKNGKTIEDALDNYYKSGYRKRYTEFTNNWSEATVKNTTYIYTKNKYMGVIRWPLFDYDFQTNQSKAARDAFAEFVLERRKNE